MPSTRNGVKHGKDATDHATSSQQKQKKQQSCSETSVRTPPPSDDTKEAGSLFIEKTRKSPRSTSQVSKDSSTSRQKESPGAEDVLCAARSSTQKLTNENNSSLQPKTDDGKTNILSSVKSKSDDGETNTSSSKKPQLADGKRNTRSSIQPKTTEGKSKVPLPVQPKTDDGRTNTPSLQPETADGKPNNPSLVHPEATDGKTNTRSSVQPKTAGRKRNTPSLKSNSKTADGKTSSPSLVQPKTVEGRTNTPPIQPKTGDGKTNTPSLVQTKTPDGKRNTPKTADGDTNTSSVKPKSKRANGKTSSPSTVRPKTVDGKRNTPSAQPKTDDRKSKPSLEESKTVGTKMDTVSPVQPNTAEGNADKHSSWQQKTAEETTNAPTSAQLKTLGGKSSNPSPLKSKTAKRIVIEQQDMTRTENKQNNDVSESCCTDHLQANNTAVASGKNSVDIVRNKSSEKKAIVSTSNKKVFSVVLESSESQYGHTVASSARTRPAKVEIKSQSIVSDSMSGNETPPQSNTATVNKATVGKQAEKGKNKKVPENKSITISNSSPQNQLVAETSSRVGSVLSGKVSENCRSQTAVSLSDIDGDSSSIASAHTRPAKVALNPHSTLSDLESGNEMETQSKSTTVNKATVDKQAATVKDKKILGNKSMTLSKSSPQNQPVTSSHCGPVLSRKVSENSRSEMTVSESDGDGFASESIAGVSRRSDSPSARNVAITSPIFSSSQKNFNKPPPVLSLRTFFQKTKDDAKQDKSNKNTGEMTITAKHNKVNNSTQQTTATKQDDNSSRGSSLGKSNVPNCGNENNKIIPAAKRKLVDANQNASNNKAASSIHDAADDTSKEKSENHTSLHAEPCSQPEENSGNLKTQGPQSLCQVRDDGATHEKNNTTELSQSPAKTSSSEPLIECENNTSARTRLFVSSGISTPRAASKKSHSVCNKTPKSQISKVGSCVLDSNAAEDKTTKTAECSHEDSKTGKKSNASTTSADAGIETVLSNAQEILTDNVQTLSTGSQNTPTVTRSIAVSCSQREDCVPKVVPEESQSKTTHSTVKKRAVHEEKIAVKTFQQKCIQTENLQMLQKEQKHSLCQTVQKCYQQKHSQTAQKCYQQRCVQTEEKPNIIQKQCHHKLIQTKVQDLPTTSSDHKQKCIQTYEKCSQTVPPKHVQKHIQTEEKGFLQKQKTREKDSQTNRVRLTDRRVQTDVRDRCCEKTEKRETDRCVQTDEQLWKSLCFKPAEDSYNPVDWDKPSLQLQSETKSYNQASHDFVSSQTEQGSWQFALLVSSLTLADLAKEELQSVCDSAQDYVIKLSGHKPCGKREQQTGYCWLYFERLYHTKCAMKKLLQLQWSSKTVEIELIRRFPYADLKRTISVEMKIDTTADALTTVNSSKALQNYTSKDQIAGVSNIPSELTRDLLFVIFPMAYAILVPENGRTVLEFRGEQTAAAILKRYSSVRVNSAPLHLCVPQSMKNLHVEDVRCATSFENTRKRATSGSNTTSSRVVTATQAKINARETVRCVSEPPLNTARAAETQAMTVPSVEPHHSGQVAKILSAESITPAAISKTAAELPHKEDFVTKTLSVTTDPDKSARTLGYQRECIQKGADTKLTAGTTSLSGKTSTDKQLSEGISKLAEVIPSLKRPLETPEALPANKKKKFTESDRNVTEMATATSRQDERLTDHGKNITENTTEFDSKSADNDYKITNEGRKSEKIINSKGSVQNKEPINGKKTASESVHTAKKPSNEMDTDQKIIEDLNTATKTCCIDNDCDFKELDGFKKKTITVGPIGSTNTIKKTAEHKKPVSLTNTTVGDNESSIYDKKTADCHCEETVTIDKETKTTGHVHSCDGTKKTTEHRKTIADWKQLAVDYKTETAKYTASCNATKKSEEHNQPTRTTTSIVKDKLSKSDKKTRDCQQLPTSTSVKTTKTDEHTDPVSTKKNTKKSTSGTKLAEEGKGPAATDRKTVELTESSSVNKTITEHKPPSTIKANVDNKEPSGIDKENGDCEKLPTVVKKIETAEPMEFCNATKKTTKKPPSTAAQITTADKEPPGTYSKTAELMESTNVTTSVELKKPTTGTKTSMDNKQLSATNNGNADCEESGAVDKIFETAIPLDSSNGANKSEEHETSALTTKPAVEDKETSASNKKNAKHMDPSDTTKKMAEQKKQTSTTNTAMENKEQSCSDKMPADCEKLATVDHQKSETSEPLESCHSNKLSVDHKKHARAAKTTVNSKELCVTDKKTDDCEKLITVDQKSQTAETLPSSDASKNVTEHNKPSTAAKATAENKEATVTDKKKSDCEKIVAGDNQKSETAEPLESCDAIKLSVDHNKSTTAAKTTMENTKLSVSVTDKKSADYENPVTSDHQKSETAESLESCDAHKLFVDHKKPTTAAKTVVDNKELSVTDRKTDDCEKLAAINNKARKDEHMESFDAIKKTVEHKKPTNSIKPTVEDKEPPCIDKKRDILNATETSAEPKKPTSAAKTTVEDKEPPCIDKKRDKLNATETSAEPKKPTSAAKTTVEDKEPPCIDKKRDKHNATETSAEPKKPTSSAKTNVGDQEQSVADKKKADCKQLTTVDKKNKTADHTLSSNVTKKSEECKIKKPTVTGEHLERSNSTKETRDEMPSNVAKNSAEYKLTHIDQKCSKEKEQTAIAKKTSEGKEPNSISPQISEDKEPTSTDHKSSKHGKSSSTSMTFSKHVKPKETSNKYAEEKEPSRASQNTVEEKGSANTANKPVEHSPIRLNKTNGQDKLSTDGSKTSSGKKEIASITQTFYEHKKSTDIAQKTEEHKDTVTNSKTVAKISVKEEKRAVTGKKPTDSPKISVEEGKRALTGKKPTDSPKRSAHDRDPTSSAKKTAKELTNTAKKPVVKERISMGKEPSDDNRLTGKNPVTCNHLSANKRKAELNELNSTALKPAPEYVEIQQKPIASPKVCEKDTKHGCATNKQTHDRKRKHECVPTTTSSDSNTNLRSSDSLTVLVKEARPAEENTTAETKSTNQVPSSTNVNITTSSNKDDILCVQKIDIAGQLSTTELQENEKTFDKRKVHTVAALYGDIGRLENPTHFSCIQGETAAKASGNCFEKESSASRKPAEPKKSNDSTHTKKSRKQVKRSISTEDREAEKNKLPEHLIVEQTLLGAQKKCSSSTVTSTKARIKICCHCQARFSSKLLLKTHIDWHCLKVYSVCQKCLKKIRGRPTFLQHMKDCCLEVPQGPATDEAVSGNASKSLLTKSIESLSGCSEKTPSSTLTSKPLSTQQTDHNLPAASTPKASAVDRASAVSWPSLQAKGHPQDLPPLIPAHNGDCPNRSSICLTTTEQDDIPVSSTSDPPVAKRPRLDQPLSPVTQNLSSCPNKSAVPKPGLNESFKNTRLPQSEGSVISQMVEKSEKDGQVLLGNDQKLGHNSDTCSLQAKTRTRIEESYQSPQQEAVNKVHSTSESENRHSQPDGGVLGEGQDNSLSQDVLVTNVEFQDVVLISDESQDALDLAITGDHILNKDENKQPQDRSAVNDEDILDENENNSKSQTVSVTNDVALGEDVDKKQEDHESNVSSGTRSESVDLRELLMKKKKLKNSKRKLKTILNVVMEQNKRESPKCSPSSRAKHSSNPRSLLERRRGLGYSSDKESDHKTKDKCYRTSKARARYDSEESPKKRGTSDRASRRRHSRSPERKKRHEKSPQRIDSYYRVTSPLRLSGPIITSSWDKHVKDDDRNYRKYKRSSSSESLSDYGRKYRKDKRSSSSETLSGYGRKYSKYKRSPSSDSLSDYASHGSDRDSDNSMRVNRSYRSRKQKKTRLRSPSPKRKKMSHLSGQRNRSTVSDELSHTTGSNQITVRLTNQRDRSPIEGRRMYSYEFSYMNDLQAVSSCDEEMKQSIEGTQRCSQTTLLHSGASSSLISSVGQHCSVSSAEHCAQSIPLTGQLGSPAAPTEIPAVSPASSNQMCMPESPSADSSGLTCSASLSGNVPTVCSNTHSHPQVPCLGGTASVSSPSMSSKSSALSVGVDVSSTVSSTTTGGSPVLSASFSTLPEKTPALSRKSLSSTNGTPAVSIQSTPPRLIPVLSSVFSNPPRGISVSSTLSVKSPRPIPVLSTLSSASPKEIPVLSTLSSASPKEIPVLSTLSSALPKEIPVLSTLSSASPKQIPVLSTLSSASPKEIPVLSNPSSTPLTETPVLPSLSSSLRKVPVISASSQQIPVLSTQTLRKKPCVATLPYGGFLVSSVLGVAPPVSTPSSVLIDVQPGDPAAKLAHDFDPCFDVHTTSNRSPPLSGRKACIDCESVDKASPAISDVGLKKSSKKFSSDASCLSHASSSFTVLSANTVSPGHLIVLSGDVADKKKPCSSSQPLKDSSVERSATLSENTSTPFTPDTSCLNLSVKSRDVSAAQSTSSRLLSASADASISTHSSSSSLSSSRCPPSPLSSSSLSSLNAGNVHVVSTALSASSITSPSASVSVDIPVTLSSSALSSSGPRNAHTALSRHSLTPSPNVLCGVLSTDSSDASAALSRSSSMSPNHQSFSRDLLTALNVSSSSSKRPVTPTDMPGLDRLLAATANLDPDLSLEESSKNYFHCLHSRITHEPGSKNRALDKGEDKPGKSNALKAFDDGRDAEGIETRKSRDPDCATKWGHSSESESRKKHYIKEQGRRHADSRNADVMTLQQDAGKHMSKFPKSILKSRKKEQSSKSAKSATGTSADSRPKADSAEHNRRLLEARKIALELQALRDSLPPLTASLAPPTPLTGKK